VDREHRNDRGRDNAAAQHRSGLLIGLATLLVAAYPVSAAASMAHASFSGCWLACGGTTSPVLGTVWVVIAAALLAAPIGLGLRVAQVRSRTVWATVALVLGVAAVAWVAFSVSPANGNFFINLGE
jgi:hypothetical protein